MVQVLYFLEVFILAHYYGPPSTETPTTETTIVQCHKNSWIYLTSTYYWWLLRPMITIWFDSKFQIIPQLFHSIRNEKKTLFAQHFITHDRSMCVCYSCWCLFNEVEETLIDLLHPHNWDKFKIRQKKPERRSALRRMNSVLSQLSAQLWQDPR